MTKTKKKAVHPPLKRKRQKLSKEFADMESLLNLRMNPVKNARVKPNKRTYHAETLGLPPLKMVLLHAQNDRANAAKPRRNKELSQQEAVMKIIEHLTKNQ